MSAWFSAAAATFFAASHFYESDHVNADSLVFANFRMILCTTIKLPDGSLSSSTIAAQYILTILVGSAMSLPFLA